MWRVSKMNFASFVRKINPPAITDAERMEISALGAQLPRLWNHPAASAATRKRILRTVLEEIVVTVEPGQLLLKLHWNGGDHTALAVLKNRVGNIAGRPAPQLSN